MIDTFHTERLAATRISADDYADLCALHRDPRVMKTLSVDGLPLADEVTRERLDAHIEHWQRYGFGQWIWRERASGAFVGRGGLWRCIVDERDEIELAYALAADCWGRGFATELARASIKVEFERIKLAEIVCFTLATNRASQRVMEKCGFQYERAMSHVGLPHVLYRLHAATYAAMQPA